MNLYGQKRYQLIFLLIVVISSYILLTHVLNKLEENDLSEDNQLVENHEENDLFEDNQLDENHEESDLFEDNQTENNTPLPFKHENLERIINDKKQVINIIEVDLSNSDIEVKPVLSYNLIYGFETLSDIAKRNDSIAAVNGGFFHEYGEPGGMLMINGELITKPASSLPILVINDQKAYFSTFSIEMKIDSDEESIVISDINKKGSPSASVAYTPVYGSDNRASKENTTVFIKNNEIISIEKRQGASRIPSDGMLITFYPPYNQNQGYDKLKAGQELTFEYSPYLGENTHAYECGSKLVTNGENVAQIWDAWVGVLTNHDPRTAVGIKDDKTLVFITVDGRQPGYSYGLTARELADLFIEYGVTEAAMLDGGASTSMYIDGSIVNKSSASGAERKIAGAFVITYR